jgi:hypothetical protein
MGVPAPHVPVPLQVPALVSVLPEQVAEPQAVLDAACWQTPPAAQLPVFPHGGAAVHWPAGAGAPDVTAAQVPLGEPVKAMVHA